MHHVAKRWIEISTAHDAKAFMDASNHQIHGRLNWSPVATVVKINRIDASH
jgi:hypothetical protein